MRAFSYTNAQAAVDVVILGHVNFHTLWILIIYLLFQIDKSKLPLIDLHAKTIFTRFFSSKQFLLVFKFANSSSLR